jgi:hypothetical protein
MALDIAPDRDIVPDVDTCPYVELCVVPHEVIPREELVADQDSE